MPITSPEEAQSVARLIQEGKITGAGKDQAMADLRAFDTHQGASQAANDLTSGAAWNAGGERAAEAIGVGIPETAASMVSGTAGLFAGLVAKYGLGNLIPAPGVRQTLGEMAKQKIQSALTYEPTNPDAQSAMKVISWPLAKGREYAVKGGEMAGLGQEVGDAYDLATLALGVRGGLRSGVPAESVGSFERQGAVRVLQDHGVPLKLSERSEAAPARVVGYVSDALPTKKFEAGRSEKYTQAVLKVLGVDSKRASPKVMEAKDAALGAIYEDINAKVPTKYDKPLATDLRTKLADAVGDLGAEAAPLERQVAIIQSKVKPGGIIDGSAAQASRAALTRLANQKTNPTLSHHASQLVEVMNDALERSAPSAELARLKKANQEYRILKQVEAAVRGESSALVDPAALWKGVSTKKNGSQTVYGRGDQSLIELARAGDLILNPAKDTGGIRGAIPATGAGIAITAMSHPAVATAIGAGIFGSRALNHSQIVGKALGGTGFRGIKPGMNNAEIAAIISQASSPAERKRILEEFRANANSAQ